MRYILNPKIKLRGWANRPAGIINTELNDPVFFPNPSYRLLFKCDGAHDIDPDSMDPEDRLFLDNAVKEGYVRPAGFMEFLNRDQMYKKYPTVYKKDIQWSVTGACNLKCRHCFMSAPQAKHGSPSHEQIINIADQLTGRRGTP
ncbi:MAG: hypothetical protein IK093_03780 [Ruminiclostridium sp.]|nr:hypothetical protein [Ruminiclostridium sp.]